VFTVAVIGALGACGKGNGATQGDNSVAPGRGAAGSATDRSSAPPAGDTGSARSPVPTGDVVRSPDRLPSGAVAIIGAPVLSNPASVDDIALSSRGQLLTCGGSYARLWEVASGRLLWSHRAPSGSLRCALSPDGAQIAVVAENKSESSEIVVHDWKAGTRTTGATSGIAPWFGLDGASFVVARGGVSVRDTQTNKPTRSPEIAGVAAGLAVDGALIVVARTTVVRVKSDGASEPVATLPATIESAVVSADASRVAWTTGKQVGTIDVATGAVTPLPDPGGRVEHIALSPKGDLVAVGAGGGLSVWELAGAKRLWGVAPKARGQSPALGFSPDGKSLAYAGTGRAIIADARTGNAPPAPPAHRFAGWTPAGAAIVADEAGGKVALDLKTFASTSRFEPIRDPADRPAWAHTIIRGTGLVVAYDDEQTTKCGPLKLWIEGKGERTLAKPRGCNDDVVQVWFVGPGIAISNTSSPAVWDAVESHKLFDLDIGLRPLVTAQVSPDGQRLLVVLGPAPAPKENDADAFGEKEPRSGTHFDVWSIPDRKLLGSLRVAAEGVYDAVLSKEGSRAFLGWRDGTVASLDTKVLSAPRTIGVHAAPVQSLALSPDGALLAVTDLDGATTIWRP
jgi:WD40 repeat protein